MLEIIKQLALDAAEKGSDFCVGTVTKGGTADNSTGGRTGADRGVSGADGGCFAGRGNGQYTD